MRALMPRRAPVGFNMTPMIDVVFLLIIFFLVSSHLAQRENRIQVDLPTAQSGDADRASESPRVTLTLEPNGQLWLGARRVQPDDLSRQLIALRGQEGDTLELRVRCDRSVPYRQVEPILNSAVQAGVWNVSFAVFEPKP